MKTYIQQKKSKTTFLIFVLLLVSLLKIDSLFAQTSDKIVFTYDAAGNRIQRKLSITADPDDPAFKMENETASIIEIKDTVLITAFPNPTSAELNVKFELLPSNAVVTIKVTDYSGREMLNIKQDDQNEIVNLDGFANGIYLVNISINDKNKLLKVIKQ